MKWDCIQAWNLVPGDIVAFNGDVRKIGSTHYSGDDRGNGIVTLCFTDGTESNYDPRQKVRFITD